MLTKVKTNKEKKGHYEHMCYIAVLHLNTLQSYSLEYVFE